MSEVDPLLSSQASMAGSQGAPSQRSSRPSSLSALPPAQADPAPTELSGSPPASPTSTYVPVKPALRLCGRRLRVASDDFAVLGWCPLILQALQLSGAVLLLLSIYDTRECSAGTPARVFAMLWTAGAGLAVMLDVALMLLSLCGSVSETARRDALVAPVYLLSFTVDMLQLGVIVYAAVVLFDALVDCPQAPWNLLYACVIFGLMVVLMRLVRVGYVLRINCLCCCPALPPVPEERAVRPKALPSDMRWSNMLRLICCCAKTPEREVWLDVAGLFSLVFGEEEYTLSDLAVGVRLVNQYHTHLRKSRRAKDRDHYALAPWSPREPLRPVSAQQDGQVLAEMLDVLPFALGAFGWPLFCLMKNPLGGACHILASLQIGCCCNTTVKGDNPCRCNTAAFLLQSGLEAEDLLYGNLHNNVCRPHFYLVANRPMRALILAVRGTLSASDLITDGMARVISDPMPGQPNQHIRAHAGVWNSARQIRKELIDSGVLADIFAAQPELRGYRLLTTGQSLGGAVASALALQLQADKKPEGISSVHGYAFSPAPIVGKDALEYSQKHVTGVTLGHDMVSCLSLINLRRAKLLVRSALEHSRDSKCRIMCGGCVGLRPTHAWWEHVDLEALQNVQAPDMEELWIPGRIVHLVKSKPRARKWLGLCHAPREYEAYWSDAANFDYMWIDHRMVLDHMPDHLWYRLKEVVAKLGIERSVQRHDRESPVTTTSEPAFLAENLPTSPNKRVIKLAHADEYSEV